jgi:hypothetical protein
MSGKWNQKCCAINLEEIDASVLTATTLPEVCINLASRQARLMAHAHVDATRH